MSAKLLISCICIHLLLIYAIFDVYYKSPIIHDLKPHLFTNDEAPSKRIVIFSADGLRYDTFNEHPEMSPYLHSMIRNGKSCSGLSISHVPTESRPGHVAIFAGITEDLSAVAKGWKKNPVKFDSVFNRSLSSYMWGSPDIISLFSESNNVQSFTYSEQEQDFSSNDAANLDRWVFEKFQNFLAENKENNKINGQQHIFFLHLLGIDTNGHGYKPNSRKYIENIKVVDDGIKMVQMLVEEHFRDNKTTYLFTSDHGMTEWGSHGAGTDHELLTPFVVWGNGIRKCGTRVKINQIDLAPFISTMIGSAIPVNSVGILPLKLIKTEKAGFEFRASYINFKQLKEQLKFLKNQKSHRFWFEEFRKFNDKSLNSLENEIIRLARIRRYEAAITLFSEKAHLLIEAIDYYHRYDRHLLGIGVGATFVSWILLLSTFLVESKTDLKSLLIPNYVFSGLIVMCIIFSFYCPLTFSQSMYIVIPVYLLSLFNNNIHLFEYLGNIYNHVVKTKNVDSIMNRFSLQFAGFVFFAMIVFLFVLAFIDRRFVSFIFVLMAFIPNVYKSNSVTCSWSSKFQIISLLLTPFPFLPAVGVETHTSLCVISPLLMGLACYYLSNKLIFKRLQFLLKIFAIYLTSTSIFILIGKVLFAKPPLIFRFISWITIPLSFIIPSILSSDYVVDRLLSYSIAFYVPYSLLSISYESLFILLFIPLIFIYYRLEYSETSDIELLSATIYNAKVKNSPKLSSEILRAIICVGFVLGILFGTGNFASINSFNPSTLNLFISVFSPFTMAILLIFKLLLPTLCVSLLMASILQFDINQIKRLCCIVLIVTDIMSMCFFYQLKDSGSWLEIGMSISQYIVSMCISLALLILLSFSTLLMRFNIWTTTGFKNVDI